MIRLTPPTRAGAISSGWGADRSYRDGWHQGLDFPGRVGDPVLAAADGVVVRAQSTPSGFAGRFVSVDHGEGFMTRYLHLNRLAVALGAQVRRGQPIGELGTSGTVNAAPHVHFDTQVTAEGLARYQSQHARPTTGFPAVSSGRFAVPSEPIMDGAMYSDRAKQQMAAAGVSGYRTPWPMYAALGIGLYAVYRMA